MAADVLVKPVVLRRQCIEALDLFCVEHQLGPGTAAKTISSTAVDGVGFGLLQAR